MSTSQHRRDSRPADTVLGRRADQLVELARRRLHSSSHAQIRHIHCDLRDGALTLYGRVPSYYLKQLAQELVGGPSAEAPIDNRIVVASRHREAPISFSSRQ